MAARTPTRPGRLLAVVALVLVGLYAGVATGGTFAPKLGLDLRGGTSVILRAQAPSGGKVTSSALAEAVNIIRNRVNGLGVAEAQVTTQGSDNIVVAVPGKGRQEVVALVGQTAQLRFRQVRLAAPAGPAPPASTPSPVPTPSTATSGSPRPQASPSASAPAKARPQASPTSTRPRALSGALLAGGVLPRASASPAASASPKGSASPAASASPKASAQPTPNPSAPATSAQQKFATLTCTANTPPKSGADDPNQPIAACARDGSEKYLLEPAAVLGNQIKSASANLDAQSAQGWTVDLTFKGKGTSRWCDLTRKAFNAGQGTPANRVAIVLDGQVVSAPQIIQPICGGQAQITGQFTQAQAQDLANVLKYGALPLKFTTQSVEDVSPTLGSDQLRGGLIAGAIGLGLVVLYSLLYYRGLGLVTIASLVLSGGLLYASVILLGSAIGYTLTLAGIAGFIVAVGITADSFVVFFERIRDEVREGRAASVRSAVERAWPRARHTIISADMVSILAAVILYLLSVGSVRGFAFTLGLSTVSDLFIVFLFTKPLVSLLVRTRLFGPDSRFSGLGGGRMGNAPALRRTAVKRSA